jgi:hypothetical protein
MTIKAIATLSDLAVDPSGTLAIHVTYAPMNSAPIYGTFDFYARFVPGPNREAIIEQITDAIQGDLAGHGITVGPSDKIIVL